MINSNGTATYVFTPSTLHIGLGVSWPTGTIQSVDILIDVQGSADISKISVNGEPQTAKHPKASEACKHGGWKNFHNPSFKNQGQCVSYFNHHNGKGHDDDHSDNGKGHHDDDHSDYGHGHHH